MTDISMFTIGNKTINSLINEFEEKSINVGNFLKEYLLSENFTLSTEPKSITVKEVKLSDLGIMSAVSLEEIYSRAKESGYNLCSSETLLYYALEVKSVEEDIVLAMTPVMNTVSGNEVVFGLTQGFNSEHADKKYVGVLQDHPIKSDTKFSPQEIFLFAVDAE